MAERPPSPESPLQSSHLSLSCSSCGDEVDEVKCLPCLHSLPLCDKAACHQKALQRGVTCQQCQEVFPAPSGGFPPHQLAGRKAVSKQCEEKDAFCHEDHDEPQKAVAYCPQCPGAICEECVQVHRSKKIYKSHTTLPLSKAVSESSITRKVAFVCEKHAEKQRLYCTECETLICALCHSVGDHKSHSVLFIDDETGEKNKSTLKSCIASAERSIARVTKALDQVEGSIDVMQQQSDNAKVEIGELIDHLVAILRTRQAALVGEVDQLKERIGGELQQQKEKLNQQLTELNQFKLLAEDLLQHGIPMEQISLKKSVVRRIAALTAAPLSAPPQLSCSIHFDSSTVKENLKEELSQLGSLACAASPLECTMEDLPAPDDNGVLLIPSVPVRFKVVTRDKDSKPCMGGDRVLATLSTSTCGVPVGGRVEDKGDGTYQVQFNTLPANGCQLSVTVNGGHTKGSPLEVKAHTVQDIGKEVKVSKKQGVQRKFQALSIGRNGCVIAADNKSKEVCIFDQAGGIASHFKVLRDSCKDIYGIVETQEGNIAVSTERCVKVYTSGGKFLKQLYDTGGGGLAVNAKGQLFVVDYNSCQVSVFDQNGHHQYSFGSAGDGPGQFKIPCQICVAPDELVYVTDNGQNSVQVFEQDGTFVRQFGENVLKSPTGVAATKDGHVVVASWGAHKLSIFTLEGQCVREVTDIDLNSPYGVAVDAYGWLYVADHGNHRVFKL